MARRRWRQTANGFVEIDLTGAPPPSFAPSIRTDVQPFRSPIDGSIINTRVDLLNHNQRNNVSNDLDSLKEKTSQYLEGYGKAPTGGKQERIKELVEAYDRASTPGFGRREFFEDSQLQ